MIGTAIRSRSTSSLCGFRVQLDFEFRSDAVKAVRKLPARRRIHRSGSLLIRTHPIVFQVRSQPVVHPLRFIEPVEAPTLRVQPLRVVSTAQRELLLPGHELLQRGVGLPGLARRGVGVGRQLADDPAVIEESILKEVPTEYDLGVEQAGVAHLRGVPTVRAPFGPARPPAAEGEVPPTCLEGEEHDAAGDEDQRGPEHAVDDVRLGVSLVDDDVVEIGRVVVAGEGARLRRVREPRGRERFHLSLVLFRVLLTDVEGTLEKRKHPNDRDCN